SPAAPPASGQALWAATALGLALLILVLLAAVARWRPTAGPGRAPVAGTPDTRAAAPTSVLTAAQPTTADVRPSALPSITPTPAATRYLEPYTVQVGDTCSEIAERFAITVSLIVEINRLPDGCGVIYAGQTLLIPRTLVDGVPQDLPSATPRQPQTTRLAETDGMLQVYIPAGEFQMGSDPADRQAGDEEKPAHAVYLRAYWIDRTEVTNAMYARCEAAGDCQPPAQRASKTRPDYYGAAGFENYPVIYVAWEDARAYCAWADRRLPSEAEWEKAARGEDARPYPWGDRLPSAALANFNSQVGDTLPAGSYPAGASPYGVLDLAGNVAEWVADWYTESYYSLAPYTNPPGPRQGEFRVLRGGSWFSQARAMRAAFRLWNYPALQADTVGFRCAQ
ncbi:MAG: SUMF1/EgtB/PvdO family nonheme iron enzyme, partial [Chloroflexota bacterium]